MSGYTNFAVIGAGAIRNHIVQQHLKDKAAGIVKEVVVLTRQVTKSSQNLHNYDLQLLTPLETRSDDRYVPA